MGRQGWAALLLLLLLLLLALLVARAAAPVGGGAVQLAVGGALSALAGAKRRGTGRAPLRVRFREDEGGGEARHGTAEAAQTGEGEAPQSPTRTPQESCACGGGPAPESLHAALVAHGQSLGAEDLVGVHRLERGEYTGELEGGRGGGGAPPEAAHGAEGGGRKGGRAWTEHGSWAELRKDAGALRAYMEARAEALRRPDYDWGPVLREVAPLLHEDREYVGLVNLGGDGRTLVLAALEASPTRAGTLPAAQGFAEVPGALVERVARRPALYLFHTHVADPRSSPLPSAHDVATAVRLAAAAHYAASALVSRYGVFTYGLDWGGYAAIHRAPRWHEAARNVSHDAAAAFTATRSWGPHTLAEFAALFARLRLGLYVYPAPAMVADTARLQEVGLETPADYTLLAALGREAEGLRARRALRLGHRAARARLSARALDVDYGLDAARAAPPAAGAGEGAAEEGGRPAEPAGGPTEAAGAGARGGWS